MRQYIPFKPERSGIGTGGPDPGVGEGENGVGKTLFQYLINHGTIACRLGDRAAEEGHVTGFFLLKLKSRVVQVAAYLNIVAERGVACRKNHRKL